MRRRFEKRFFRSDSGKNLKSKTCTEPSLSIENLKLVGLSVIAFVLVVLVIYVFLGRATDTLIPAVALPLSLFITVAVMYMLDYSINNLTLMALTLAIGFLVDDAIVFLENVVRRAEQGESIVQATYNSAGEISFTILSMTLSLAAVFIPLVFLPGLLGRIFREFSVTIIVAILASGLVSLTLTPLMCAPPTAISALPTEHSATFSASSTAFWMLWTALSNSVITPLRDPRDSVMP